jgi:HK97 gp10 family phage protein
VPPTPSCRLVVTDDPVKRLRSLTKGAKNQIMRKAVRAGAAPVRAAVRADAPVLSGATQKSITVKVGTNRKTGEVYAAIGPQRRYVFKRQKKVVSQGATTRILHLILFGTQAAFAHQGRPARPPRPEGRPTVGRHHRLHPGAKENNFMARGFASASASAVVRMRRAITEEVSRRLGKAIKKAGIR